MSTLIIGGCGFIGSHIAEELSKHDERLVILDRNADQPNRRRVPATYIAGEFGNRGELEAVLINHAIQLVVHLASSTVPGNSNRDPEFDVRTNVVETIALLDLCVKHRVKKILFLSSGGTVYGIPRYVPVDEEHPTHPISSYGVTKLTIEKYLQLYHHLHKLDFVALRAANPYGPHQRPIAAQGAIAVFSYRMLRGEEISVWGDGSVVRDYFHVRDLARLCVAALLGGECGVFNAGSGVGLSLREVIGAIEHIVGRPARIRWELPRALDVPRIILECSRAQRCFDWTPEIVLEEGLREVVRWLKSDWVQQPIASK